MLYLVSHLSSFFPFWLVISLFKIALKHRAAMLSSVPKCEKTLMCLVEKIHVLDQLCLGMSDHVVFVGSGLRTPHKTRFCTES